MLLVLASTDVVSRRPCRKVENIYRQTRACVQRVAYDISMAGAVHRNMDRPGAGLRAAGSAQSMSRYVNPKSASDPSSGHHDRGLEIADESSPGYLRWVADLAIPHLGASTLEVGSGHGAVTQHLARGRRLVATDLSESCLKVLRVRFADWRNVEVRHMDIREMNLSEKFDSVVIINVLEHIFDDAGALRALGERLNPGGNCLIYVPALNGLYGPYDRDVGHYRRYSTARLDSVVREAGLVPAQLHYVNLLAIPAWVLFSSRWIDRDDHQGFSGSLRVWDRVGVPLTRAIESRVRPPIGLNVFCVARIPAR
jgi:2-polyprenyl-3-methyl-5-hydroxy-6-metoxy-1,4-benzoquinol methylase